MTKTLDVVEPRDEEPLGPAPEVLDEAALLETGLSPDEVSMVAALVRRAKDQGLALTGPGGLLKSLTKTVLETALEEELSEHLGYDKHDPTGRNLGNCRNGCGGGLQFLHRPPSRVPRSCCPPPPTRS